MQANGMGNFCIHVYLLWGNEFTNVELSLTGRIGHGLEIRRKGRLQMDGIGVLVGVFFITSSGMIISFNISRILLRGMGRMDSSSMFSWRHQHHP